MKTIHCVHYLAKIDSVVKYVMKPSHMSRANSNTKEMSHSMPAGIIHQEIIGYTRKLLRRSVNMQTYCGGKCDILATKKSLVFLGCVNPQLAVFWLFNARQHVDGCFLLIAL